jgi:hypothetical protein
MTLGCSKYPDTSSRPTALATLFGCIIHHIHICMAPKENKETKRKRGRKKGEKLTKE